ncbi:MAG TPA: acyltransferase [Actinomycetes bacterium]
MSTLLDPHTFPAGPRRPPGRWGALARRLEAVTPPGRERAIDGLRALAIAGVVVGHFLVMALIVGRDGALHGTSPLEHLPAFAPLSWALQLLGLFFLVGGYSGARSLERARARGVRYGAWLRGRLVRLARPVAAAVVALSAALLLLGLAGVPGGTLRTAAVMEVQPLWFIAVYLLVTALTPGWLALDRRLGAWAAAPGVLLVAVVDLLRYGPWHHVMPGWLGLVNVLPGWSFAYLLGIAWAHGRIGRRGSLLLAAGGGALGLLLVLRFGYPASMVGVPGAARVNSHPPSLLVPALAALQSGLAIRLRDRIEALLRRPRLWAAVALANLGAMTIFCWHQIALVTLTGATLLLAPGGLPGLHDAPDGPGWVLHRLAWFPAHLAVLSGFVVLARRFESGGRGHHGGRRIPNPPGGRSWQSR